MRCTISLREKNYFCFFFTSSLRDDSLLDLDFITLEMVEIDIHVFLFDFEQ